LKDELRQTLAVTHAVKRRLLGDSREVAISAGAAESGLSEESVRDLYRVNARDFLVVAGVELVRLGKLSQAACERRCEELLSALDRGSSTPHHRRR